MILKKVGSLLCVALVALTFSGCGPGSTEVQPIAVSPKDMLKANLQSPAETGTLGSEMVVIEENIEKLAAEDAAKADVLRADLEELKKANNPSKVKSKAKEMIGKL